MASEPGEPIERWMAKRRATLVLRPLKGDTSVAETTRQHGLTVGEVENWQEQFLRVDLASKMWTPHSLEKLGLPTCPVTDDLPLVHT